MPGLIRGAARVAVVAGTATAVSNRVSRRQANRWAAKDQQQQQQDDQQQYEQPPQQYEQQPAAAPQEAAGGSMDDKLAQLKQLGELKDAGVLTDYEFEDQKRKILGS